LDSDKKIPDSNISTIWEIALLKVYCYENGGKRRRDKDKKIV